MENQMQFFMQTVDESFPASLIHSLRFIATGLIRNYPDQLTVKIFEMDNFFKILIGKF
jgi:hypothetical protein